MKRSEMIEHMEKAFIEVVRTFGTTQDKMSHILTRMEELDILPPTMEGVYDNVPMVTPTGNYEYSWKRGWNDETV